MFAYLEIICAYLENKKQQRLQKKRPIIFAYLEVMCLFRKQNNNYNNNNNNNNKTTVISPANLASKISSVLWSVEWYYSQQGCTMQCLGIILKVSFSLHRVTQDRTVRMEIEENKDFK